MEALREKSFENQGRYQQQQVIPVEAKVSPVTSDAQKQIVDRAPGIKTLLLAVLRLGGLCVSVIFELAFGRVPLMRENEPGRFEEVAQFENPVQRKPF